MMRAVPGREMLSYFPLSHLLTEAISIPVVTRCKLPKCGFLDTRCTEEDLPKNSTVQLPLWLVRDTAQYNIFSVYPNALVNEKSCAELSVAPCEHKPTCEPGQDFFEAAQVILYLMSKKQNDLKEKYKLALTQARRYRILNPGPNLTPAEAHIARQRKECQERFDRVMQVKFK